MESPEWAGGLRGTCSDWVGTPMDARPGRSSVPEREVEEATRTSSPRPTPFDAWEHFGPVQPELHVHLAEHRRSRHIRECYLSSQAAMSLQPQSFPGAPPPPPPPPPPLGGGGRRADADDRVTRARLSRRSLMPAISPCA